MNKNIKLKISIILSLIGLLISILVYFLITPFLIKVMGKNVFGVYSLIYTIVSYFIVFDFGLGNTIVRYTAKNSIVTKKEVQNKLIGILLIIYIVIGIVTFLIGIYIYNNINNIFISLREKEIELARKMILYALINVSFHFPLSIFFNAIRGYEKFIFSEIIRIIKLIINPIIALIYIKLINNKNYENIVFLQMVINIIIDIIPLLYYFFVLKEGLIFPKKRKDFYLLPEIFVYSLYIFLSMIAMKIFWGTGQIILGVVSGASAVAVFSLSVQILQYYSIIGDTLSKNYLPQITKNYINNNNYDFSEIFSSVGKAQMIVSMLILTGFVLFGRQFILLWLNDQFTVMYKIILLIMIPLTIPIIQSIGVIITQAKNMHKFRSILYLSISITNIFITYLLSKKYDIIGAAVATVFSLVIGQIIAMNLYYKNKMKINLRKFWSNVFISFIKIAIYTLLSYLIIKDLIIVNWLKLIMCIFIYSLTYLIFIYIFVLKKDEKLKFKNVITRIIGQGKNELY